MTILIAEDADSVRNVACRYLESKGYHVLQAGNGVDALRVLEAFGGRIDVLVTDMVMPHVGGQELARTVAARCPDVKVVYMSGYPDVPGPDDGPGDHGVVLNKPFSMKALDQAIGDLLGR